MYRGKIIAHNIKTVGGLLDALEGISRKTRIIAPVDVGLFQNVNDSRDRHLSLTENDDDE